MLQVVSTLVNGVGVVAFSVLTSDGAGHGLSRASYSLPLEDRSGVRFHELAAQQITPLPILPS